MNLPESLLSLPLRALPDAVHAELAARVLTHLLRGQTIAARLAELDGRAIALHVTDTGNRIAFRIARERLVPASPSEAAVVIRGNLAAFLKLAAREEDPDTLFFQRRLSIEGDTDTGLHVKNLLDAADFDLDAHLRAVLPGPLASAATALHRRLGSFRAGHASSHRRSRRPPAARPPRPPRAPAAPPQAHR
jgi:predicted lipid carrier protein YhbT